MTSQSQALVMRQSSKFDTIKMRHFFLVNVCTICTLLTLHLGLMYSYGGAVLAAHSAQFTCWFNVFPCWCRHRDTALVMHLSSKFDAV